MHYYFDFDRTVFNTPEFKKAFARRATIPELLQQLGNLIKEVLDPTRHLPLQRIISRTFGTFASHGRFGFTPDELKHFLYPDSVTFFNAHAKDITIVTYGVRAFITAKVTNALTNVPLNDIVYTHKKKGSTIKRLAQAQTGPVVFVDDAVFQLEDVHKACPDISVIEIRRDGREGDGRWPVIRTFDELTPLLMEKNLLS